MIDWLQLHMCIEMGLQLIEDVFIIDDNYLCTELCQELIDEIHA